MPFKKGHKKTGGRKKGTRDKKDITRDLAIMTSGLTPMDFMVKVLNGEPIKLAAPERKGGGFMKGFEMHYPTFEDMKWAAQNLAQYKHPRLSAVRLASSTSKTHEDWLREIEAGPLVDDDGGKPNGEDRDGEEDTTV